MARKCPLQNAGDTSRTSDGILLRYKRDEDIRLVWRTESTISWTGDCRHGNRPTLMSLESETFQHSRAVQIRCKVRRIGLRDRKLFRYFGGYFTRLHSFGLLPFFIRNPVAITSCDREHGHQFYAKNRNNFWIITDHLQP